MMVLGCLRQLCRVRLAAFILPLTLVADPGGRVFTVQDAPGYNSWPMIQSVADDKLVCVYSRGRVHEIDEGGRGAYARVSSDGGRTWSAEVCVANDPVSCEVPIGKGRSPDGGAYFWIRCYGGTNPHHDLYKTMDGIRFLRVATPALSPLPMQITDIFSVGSELMALWFAGDYSDEPVHSWGTLTSADGGKTWRQRTVEEGLHQQDWPTEPSVVNLGNGCLLAIARTECNGPQFQLTSCDRGQTWQKVRTNISDVRASTPSLVYDETTGLIANYYYERGKGLLRRRVADANRVFGNPDLWPASEIIVKGSTSLWDAGNVNAVARGNVHWIAYYSGTSTDTGVFVLSPPPSVPGQNCSDFEDFSGSCKQTSERQDLVPMPRRCVRTDGFSSVSNVRCVVDADLPAEGYRLVISPSEVTISSHDAAGAFYARQTIRRLGNPLPCGTIEDWPSFRWRGLMLDEGRHFFGKEVVKRCLDRMAEYKLNVFHWHLTEDQGWRIALDRFPELARYGAVRPDVVAHGSRGLPSRGDCVLTGMRYGPYFYTASDISEILAYAKERHIVVVPEVELPGHLQALLAAHPEFSCRGDVPRTPRVNYDISDEVLCVGNDQAVAFMEQLYDEIVKMFPGTYVHIGGDECPRVRWKDCAKCQKRMRDLGLKDEEALQGWVTRHFTDYLAKKGRRAIGWDEVLAGEPSAETVIQCWRDAKFASAAAMKGHNVIVSPVLETYFSVSQGVSDGDPYTYLSPELTLPLEKVYRFDPLRGIDDSVKAHVLGAECCLWSECIWNLYDLEWKLLPRLCAFAEALWSAPLAPRDTDDFLRRMNIHRRRLIDRGINCAPLR